MTNGYYRFPTIHGEVVVFVCEDDLWTVSATGGVARRLTASPGESLRPALSPDGALLAYTGRDEGGPEVYVMPASGGAARRLTFLGAGRTQVAGWTPDGAAIVFASDTGQPFGGMQRLYTIPHGGGEPTPLPTGPAMGVSFGPGGAMVIARNMTDLARWKRYRGGQTGDLWVDAEGDQEWRRLIQLDGNLAAPLWIDERIYFVSDHEGVGNLYSCRPSGDDLRRHTEHRDFYVRHPASDGRRIVYHAGADLWLFDPADHSSRPIPVELHSPQPQRRRRFVDPERYLEDFDLHPSGQAVAVIARGRAFGMGNWDGPVLQFGDEAGRTRLATALPDGKRLALISDAGGEEAIEIHTIDGSAAPRRLEGLDIGRPLRMVASPRAEQLALTNQRHELLLVDLATGELRVLDRSPYGRISGPAFAPDGAWLAYTYPDTRRTSIIRLCAIAGGAIHDATRTMLYDDAPAWDPEGNYLYFIGTRDLDPVRDRTQFAWSFPRAERPFLITLRADLPSPFDPPPWSLEPRGGKEEGGGGRNGWLSLDPPPPNPSPTRGEGLSAHQEATSPPSPLVGAGGRGEEGSGDDAPPAPDPADDSPGEQSITAEAPEGEGKAEEKEKKPGPKALQIDVEGLSDRVLAFPVPVGIYRQVAGVKGKAIFTSSPLRGALNGGHDDHGHESGRLEAYDFTERSHEPLLDGVGAFTLTFDARTLAYQSGRRLRVIKAGEKPKENGGVSRKSGWIDLGRIKLSVVPPQEWRQMYREAWRLQRDQFWSADMSGVDWQAIYQRYLPLLDRVASRSEFSDLLWEMQGELGTSHAYEYGGDYRPGPSYRQGHLGADLRYDAESDSYRIERILVGDTWDEKASSPLAKPGLRIAAGDRLLAINGRRLGARQGPGELLVSQAGAEVLLTIAPASGGEPRTVTVKAMGGEGMLRYRSWVEANRAKVHAATDGKIGYVHLPNMGAWGYAEFHRLYLPESTRAGLIVDVRYNGGGNVSQLLIEKLARRRLGYDISRWGEPDPYPSDSVLGPIVALTNEWAGSDGDIFCHVFKLLNLGPLIGKRTWGGVIGISPIDRLMDGGTTTQPEYSFWFPDVGWGVENYGTEPTIEVEIAPQDDMAGADPQLERAIAEIQQMLEAQPPRLPEFGPRPRLGLPRLPEA